MDLLRHWRRRAFGAAASAVIVPVAIVLAALAVGVGGGGLGGLGALGQAFDGPQLPDVGPLPGDDGRDAADESGRLLARAQRERSSSSPPARRAGPGTRRREIPSGRDRQTATVRPPRSPGGSAPPAATPTPAPTPAPAPQPTPTPSTVRQVGDRVKEVTDPVPVVGPPAGEVIDLIVETAEGLPLP